MEKASNKLKIGILGCSRVAKKNVLPALLNTEFAELGMIGGRTAEDAQPLAEQYACAAFGTYNDVLNNPNIDIVYISLPNSLHEEWAIKSAKARKHVWCEKPAALTYTSASSMVDTSRANNVRLMEGFMFLHHPQHAVVNDLIAKDMIGPLLTFHGQFTYPFPDSTSNRFNPLLGGGSYFDSAVYPIRASRMIFNDEPESVFCHLVIDPVSGVDIKSDMILFYSEGRSATISSAFGGYFQSTYEVLGTLGKIRTDRAYAVPKEVETKIFLNKNDELKEIVIAPNDQFKLMIDDFCQEILHGESITKQYENDLLIQAKIVEAGRISHQENRIVQLSELKK